MKGILIIYTAYTVFSARPRYVGAHIFSQIWPKGVFSKPVRSERGQKNLPSGTEGGENLDLERHYEHKQHTFDSFCKTEIRHEAYNAFRQMRNWQ